jgi:hypothetical protein
MAHRENVMTKHLDMSAVEGAVQSLDEAMRVLWPCRTAEMRGLLELLVHVRMRLLQMPAGSEPLRLP